MKNVLKLGILAGFFLAFTAIGCNEGSEQVSKPMNGDASASTDNQSKAANTSQLTSSKDKATKKNEAATSSSNLPATSISFTESEWDFGTINEGDRVEHVFNFTNTGTEPLVLEKCKGSCGCTVPQCPKEPIAPGESGEIKVAFNSKGKKNKQTKKVTITANTEPVNTVLTIRAQVTPEEQIGG